MMVMIFCLIVLSVMVCARVMTEGGYDKAHNIRKIYASLGRNRTAWFINIKTQVKARYEYKDALAECQPEAEKSKRKQLQECKHLFCSAKLAIFLV